MQERFGPVRWRRRQFGLRKFGAVVVEEESVTLVRAADTAVALSFVLGALTAASFAVVDWPTAFVTALEAVTGPLHPATPRLAAGVTAGLVTAATWKYQVTRARSELAERTTAELLADPDHEITPADVQFTKYRRTLSATGGRGVLRVQTDDGPYLVYGDADALDRIDDVLDAESTTTDREVSVATS